LLGNLPGHLLGEYPNIQQGEDGEFQDIIPDGGAAIPDRILGDVESVDRLLDLLLELDDRERMISTLGQSVDMFTFNDRKLLSSFSRILNLGLWLLIRVFSRMIASFSFSVTMVSMRPNTFGRIAMNARWSPPSLK